MSIYPDRTVEQALRHADCQAEYAVPDDPYLVTDLILLAEKVRELVRELEWYIEQENGEDI